MHNFLQPDPIEETTNFIKYKGATYTAVYSLHGNLTGYCTWNIVPGVICEVKDWIEKYGGADAILYDASSVVRYCIELFGDDSYWNDKELYKQAKTTMDIGLAEFCRKAAGHPEVTHYLASRGDEDVQIVAVIKGA